MKNKIDIEKLESVTAKAEQRLLDARNSQGFWEGHLSSSAVSTAVATFALWKYDPIANQKDIYQGIDWLCENINDDGGWGDTSDSPSNLSATLLAWSALSIVKDDAKYKNTLEKCESWLISQIGDLQPDAIIKEIIAFYGNDKTFSVPILIFCTLAGRLGEEPHCWHQIPQLPFELAVFPHQLYKFFNLNVVSYALPALIGIGLVKHRKAPTKILLIKTIREKLIPKVMAQLENLQPENGGFLEAPPLTGFVAMSLCGTEFRDHIVTQKAIDYLQKGQRKDGSWPIDTNLAIWGTTLSIKALISNKQKHVTLSSSKSDHISEELSPSINSGRQYLTHKDKKFLTQWLLEQQFQTEHHFTHSEPGGWGWTNLPGAAPDADDTPGALLALAKLYKGEQKVLEAAEQGVAWLINLQNSDGGIPTFCKGWGKLPFDQSCPDLTAHAIRALQAWKKHLPNRLQKINKTIKNMIKYLDRNQHLDGYWLPLWFGNQNYPNHENPVYGTSLVIIALQEIEQEFPKVEKLLYKACTWLKFHQNKDYGWGAGKDGKSSIEETSLAIAALVGFSSSDGLARGIDFLLNQLDTDETLDANPIGLYFASLWYSEKLYPMVYSLAALNKIKKALK